MRLFLSRGVVFVVASMLASAALGDERSDRELSHVFTTRGGESLDAGRPAEALDWFLRAYDRYPSPRLHYDIAVALDELSRPALAIEHYEDFLSAETTDDEQRRYATSRIAVLEAAVGRLDLEVSPHRATVRVDNRLVTLPRPRGLPLAPGVVTIEATLQGYQPLTEDVRVRPGERRHLVITLRPAASAQAPVGSPPAAVRATPSRAATTAHAEAAPRPIYKRWWLWTVVGGLAVAGAAVGVGVALAPKSAGNDTTLPVFGPRASLVLRF